MAESLSRSRASSLPPLQQVTPQWLFNRLQTQGGLTLVDTRGFKCYDHSHIWSFINLPQPLHTPSSSTSTFTALAEASSSSPTFFSSLEGVCPLTDSAQRSWNKRKLTDVVLYDHFGMYTPSSWSMQLATLLVQERAVTSVKFLRGGMQAFQRDYPFMITGRKDPHPVSALSTPVKTTVVVDSLPRSDRSANECSQTTHALTFPNDVVPGFLYLGNVWQASQPEILRKMGITHVLSVCETAPSNPMPRITYMTVAPSSLHDAFGRSYAFLKKARKTGGKVLINCVSGVSASPTLAVYYLMRSERISLVQAYNDVVVCRPLMFPSVACMLMLVEAELYRCGFTSIQSTEAMDALQSGALKDDAPWQPQVKLSTQLSMFFLGRCNDRYVQDNMEQLFGQGATRRSSLLRA